MHKNGIITTYDLASIFKKEGIKLLFFKIIDYSHFKEVKGKYLIVVYKN